MVAAAWSRHDARMTTMLLIIDDFEARRSTVPRFRLGRPSRPHGGRCSIIEGLP